MRKNEQNTALKDTCELTQASWAFWLEQLNSAWSLENDFDLPADEFQTLRSFIADEKTTAQISGGLGTDQVRICHTGAVRDMLGCDRIYFFHPR